MSNCSLLSPNRHRRPNKSYRTAPYDLCCSTVSDALGKEVSDEVDAVCERKDISVSRPSENERDHSQALGVTCTTSPRLSSTLGIS